MGHPRYDRYPDLTGSNDEDPLQGESDRGEQQQQQRGTGAAAPAPQCQERCVNCSRRDTGPEMLNLCCLRCRETDGSDHDAQCDKRQPQPDALETSAADAKQQQPGWTEAADVDHLLRRAEWHIRESAKHIRESTKAVEALKAIIARNQYLQLKAFCHWHSILRTPWIIAGCWKLPSRVAGWARLYKAINEDSGLRRRGWARVWALPTMRPKVRRKRAEQRADVPEHEEYMMASWLAEGAKVMSKKHYQVIRPSPN